MKEMNDTKRWLGPIPKNWEYIPGKYVFHYRSEKGNDNPVLLAATQKNGMYPQDLLEGVVKVKVNTDLQQFQTVHKNDYVISLRSFQGGFEMSDYEGVCSPAYQVFFNQKPIDHRYYKYLFKSTGFIQEMDSVTVGIREGKNIPYANFGKTFIPYPSLDEQSRIAAFLDSHIAKIDDSIARYKALSDKLDEYRKAVITKAVTEGINDTCFVKCDLGWVNVIPEKWGIALLSQLYYPVKCYNYGMIERNLLSLSYGKIKRKNIENAEGLVPDNYEGYNIIEKDDIVLRLTDLQNDQKSLRVGISKEKGIVTSAYCSIRPIRDFNSTYYYYLLYAFDICKGFYGMGSGIRQGLNWNELKFMKVQIPSKPEQDEIAAYLDRKCSDIDNSKAKIETVIKKLEEYKKSLIYNAVTGKIKC